MALTKIETEVIADNAITADKIATGALDTQVASYLSTNSFATESFVSTAVANLVDSSPATLDTLNELAAALGDDPNFATTTATALGLKAPIASPTFTGTVTTDFFVQGASGAQGLNVGLSGVAGQGFSLRDTTNSRTYFITTETATGLQINTGAQPLTVTGSATFGGNVTGKNATFVTTTAASLISIGDTAASTYSLLRMYGGSGKYNFQVGVQNNVNNAFEITPSTAVGGTTFTTPALLIDGSNGNVGIGTSSPAAKLDVRGAVRFSVNTTTHETFIFTTQAVDEAKQIMKNASSVDTIVLNTGGNSWLNGGNVGIGTSSPEGRLDVNGGILSVGVSTGDDVEAEKIRIGRSNSSVRYHSIVASHSGVPASSFLAFNIHDASGSPFTAQTQALKLQGDGNVLIPNGNVGIGMSSPVAKLQVQNDSDTDYNPSTAAFNTILSLQNNTSGASNNALLSFTTESNGEWYIGGVQNSGNTAADFVFASRASGARAERMRIDASGSLLLGKTAADSIGTDGIELDGTNDRVLITRNNNEPLLLNRRTSEGDIVVFRKDGATVGSIGTSGGAVTVGKGITTLKYLDALDTIHPNGTGSGSDGLTSLGWSNNRFKDLYLSGIAYATYVGSSGDTDTIIAFDTANTIRFTTGGSEAMRIDSSGYIQMGAPISTHIGTSQLFVNRGVNAAAATSGTTQTGGALRLRGGDNAVLDMGMNSVYTWIQATDRANLANGYSLSLNPNGGNVGIGTDDPLAKLHVTNGPVVVSPGTSSHNGAYHIIGSVANFNTGNGRYMHAQLSTTVNMMFHIIMEGYTYTIGQRYGRCSGYVYNYAAGTNGATGAFGGPGVYDGRISGNIVAMHTNQNNPRIEVVIDTGNDGTNNRWGSYSLVGGTDHITAYIGIEVVQYTTSSTGSRQFTS